MRKLFLAVLLTIQLAACSAEVGSEAWCKDLKAKSKSDWSINEARDFARYCLLK